MRLVPGGVLTPRLWQLEPGARLHRPSKGCVHVVPDDHAGAPLHFHWNRLAPFISMIASLCDPPRTPAHRRVQGATDPAEFRIGAAEQSAAGRGPALRIRARDIEAGSARDSWMGRRRGQAACRPAAPLGHPRAAGHATVAYLCGNPGMIAGTVRTCWHAGLPRAHAARGVLRAWRPIRTGLTRSRPLVRVHLVLAVPDFPIALVGIRHEGSNNEDGGDRDCTAWRRHTERPTWLRQRPMNGDPGLAGAGRARGLHQDQAAARLDRSRGRAHERLDEPWP